MKPGLTSDTRRLAVLSRTPRAVLVRVGRAALWLTVAVVLARGIAALVSASATETGTPAVRASAPVWPDEPARAFAVQFATVYLDRRTADDPIAYARELAAFVSVGLIDGLVPQVDSHGPREVVRSVAVAQTQALDTRRALITVTATIGGIGSRAVRLTVPVARDRRGGLVVYDLPSLAPAPLRATVAPDAGDPLLGDERAAIADVLTRFFRAYLAGDAGGLGYLVPAGTRIGAVSGGFELVELGSIATVQAVRGGRLVLATVHARDRVSRARLALRYRVRLVRRSLRSRANR